MARSIQGSPFVRKVVIPESEETATAESDAITSPMAMTSDISGMGEFTSPRTVRAEDASSLGDTPSQRKSTRVRKSTLLATFATAANDLPSSSSEVNEEIKSKLTISDGPSHGKNIKSAPPKIIIENELLDWCQSDSKSELNVKKKVEQLVTELEGKPEEALLQLLNCVLLISGVQAQIKSDDLNVDDPAQVVLRFLNNDKLLRSPEVVLLGKRVTKDVYKKYFELFKCIGSAGMGIDAVVAVVASELIPWLTTLSSASLRALRISATVAALALLSGSCECARGLQRSAESTKRVAKRVAEVSSKVAAVEQVMQTLFDSVFVQRYRDVCEHIRAFTVEQLVCWMEAYPSVFVDNSYLRYLGWSLSDAGAQVRTEAIQGLGKVYASEGASLVSFSERFQDRIVQVIERDGHNKNRALALLDLAVSKGLVTVDLTALLVQAISADSGFDWKRCQHVVEAAFGDSASLLSSISSKLHVEAWKEWEGGLLHFASATDIMDPLTHLHSSPLAVFWIAPRNREVLAELMQLEIVHEVYLARVAAMITEHPEMVDPDALLDFAQRTALHSEEAVKRLLPAIQQYKLASSLMQQMATNSKQTWRGILALCTAAEPPMFFLPDVVDDYWIALAQIEYRRILWLLKRSPDSLDARRAVEDLHGAVAVRIRFEDNNNPRQLELILSMWVDLLLLGKKKLEPTPLVVTDADIDCCVKKVGQCKQLQTPVGLAVAKLLLAGLITPQVALRDLCALPGDFEEHEELVNLAVEHCLALGAQSLSSKFSLVRGILNMRPNLAKPLIGGLRDALRTQTDDKALSLFVEAMSNASQQDVWALVGSVLLKDLPEVKAKAIELRPFTAAQRKKRNAQGAPGESDVPSSSAPPSSHPSSSSVLEEEKENNPSLTEEVVRESPMKKPRTRTARAKPQQSRQQDDDLDEETKIIRL